MRATAPHWRMMDKCAQEQKPAADSREFAETGNPEGKKKGQTAGRMAGAWADLRGRLQFLRNDFGGESRTREKTAPQIWLPNYKRKCCLQQEQLKQAKYHFDIDAATHRLAVRPSSGAHSPVPYGRDSLFFQS